MLKSLMFPFSIFKLTTIAVIFYCGNLISQVQGDSVHIESTYAKTYTGTISKVDKEGYFIKVTNQREIFLPLTEIKFMNKINTELEHKPIEKEESKIKQTTVQKPLEKKIINKNTISENEEDVIPLVASKSKFYNEYNLNKINLSDLNYESNKDIKKLFYRTKYHLSNQIEMSAFHSYLRDELKNEIYTKEKDDLRSAYKKYIYNRQRLNIFLGFGSSVTGLSAILLSSNNLGLFLLGIPAVIIGPVLIISSLVPLSKSRILLYRTFYKYLEHKRN